MKQIIDLAKKLITIPSTADNPKALEEILKICKEELSDFNFKDFKKNGIKSLLFYNTSSLPKKFKLILNSHLDVISAKPEQYKPYEKDGKLYGRGAYDMKAAVATILLLFKEMANKVSYPLGLQIVTDEEVGGFEGTKYQIEQGVRTDFVIAGENTDLKINHKSKGILWLKIKTRGKAAHGAYPWLGENAIWKMHKVLTTLEKLYPIPNEEMWCTTANLSMIDTSNKTYNKVPDECVAYVDIRFIPEEEELVDKLQKKLGKAAKIKVMVKEPGHLTDESNFYIQLLSNIIKKNTGENAELVNKHGASDIRHYNKVGCDGITFGPIGEGHHSDNEWVDLKSIEDYYKILKNYLTRLN